MNKLILKMPKFVIEKYINDNFSLLSEEDYFEIVKMGISIPTLLYKKNKMLLKNKNVLKDVIVNAPLAIKYFDNEIFDDEILVMIANSSFHLELDYIESNPQFLKNERYREKVISMYPQLVRFLIDSEINKNIKDTLEQSDYILSIEDVDKRPTLCNSEILLKRGIKNNPRLIFDLKNVNEEMLNYALENGLDVNYEDLINGDLVKKYPKLALPVFEKNVNAIKFFDNTMLDLKICLDAVKRGFIATEEDLVNNPYLKNMAPIMKAAIKNDPKLIRTINLFCGFQLDEKFVSEILSKYKITEEDLVNNPDLCKIYSIISHYPEYELYSTFLSEDKKIQAIKNVLKSGKFDKLKDLPFLKPSFNKQTSVDSLASVANILTLNIDENDMDEAMEFNQILNNLIDGIIDIRYKKDKINFIYTDVAMLDDEVMKFFNIAKSTNRDEPLKELISKLYHFVNNDNKEKVFMTKEYIEFRINDLYQQYKLESWLSRNITTVFYNEILNKHRNCYFSEKKSEISFDLRAKMELSSKKKKLIFNGRKLEKITNIFKDNKYAILGTSKEEIIKLIKEVELELKSNKNLIKLGIVLNESILDNLSDYFINNGVLDYELIAQLLNTTNTQVLQYVFRKYEQIKLQFISKIGLPIDEQEIDETAKLKLGFNINNFAIASNDKTLENIARLLLSLTEEKAENIMFNSSAIKDIVKIIPFANLLPEFDTDMLIKIFENYSKIKNRLTANYYGFENDLDLYVMSKFQDVISLANGYSDASDLHKIILGEDVVDTIGVVNIKEYFNFYLKMLKRQSSKIPNINLEIDGYSFISANNTDPERLLIGKYNVGSCIDLDSIAGHNTFKECLLSVTGDVIIIRNLKTNEYFGRFLIFRRGNVIQLARVYDKRANNLQLSDEVLNKIASEIMKKSELANDNIEYVFVTGSTVMSNTQLPRYQDERFYREFPHADFSNRAYLIKNSPHLENKSIFINMNMHAEMNCTYNVYHKAVVSNATEKELTRIKALAIAYEENEIIKEGLLRSFVPFYREEYAYVLSGEDWYVAAKKNGEVESVLLPTGNTESKIAYEKALTELAVRENPKSIRK